MKRYIFFYIGIKYLLLTIAIGSVTIIPIILGCNPPQSPHPATVNETQTNVYPTQIPIITATISPEVAKEKALEYVSKIKDIPIENLKVYEQQTQVIDPLTREKVEYLAIGDKKSVIAKLVVDSFCKVQDIVEYQKAAGERYRVIAGHMNPGLYNLLWSKEPNDIVRVKIYASSNSEVVAFIESKGFKTTLIGYFPDGTQEVKAELPKYFILELAKRDDVLDTQEDVTTVLP